MSEADAAAVRADRGLVREHGRRRVHRQTRQAQPRYQSEADLEREFIELLQARRTSTCRSRPRRELIANLRAQLEALNGITFTDARVGAVLHRADRRRERRHRREDGPHPGGPRPAPEARRRLDQEHHADRQDEHPQQPAAGHQPVRDRPGRGRRDARPTATT